ncbi:MAG TPA: glutamate synthase subunit beta [Nitrospiria bacterium]|nr:glutamate synthase subunit beta [Nitrospiria bacterium]
MGDPKGFLKIQREGPHRRPVSQRVSDFREIYETIPAEKLKAQAARCMDCGVPFCQSETGCPVSNLIPDWNDLVYQDRWKDAFVRLHLTNNFPEFTGRLCPAPCESACVLGIIEQPVAIRNIEQFISDHGIGQGWMTPLAPKARLTQSAAIVGSGPAGLAAAQQLRRAGYKVTVYEKADRVGGLLRYGIPDFKLQKDVLDRRLEQMRLEGVEFVTNADVGKNLPVSDLLKKHDAVCLTIGAMVPRDLPLQGRDLKGIHFAMDYLTQANRMVAGDAISPAEIITAKDKRVVVIGGGDTGSDCIGTARRQGAKSIHQIEILQKPPEQRTPGNPWPLWPNIARTSHAHEEGCERLWGIMTKSFFGEKGQVREIEAVRVETRLTGEGQSRFEEISGSGFGLEADLVLLAMGFTQPVHDGLVRDLKLKLTPRGTLQVDQNFMTSEPGIFAGGDSVRGASLIVWAIAEGRKASEGMDRYLRSKRSPA